MTSKIKFHAIAIASICALVILAFFIIGPQEPIEPGKARGSNYIRVVSATWGLNCNSAINEAIRARDTVGLEKDAKGQVVRKDPIRQVQANNAIDNVKRLCEGREKCDMMATSDVLGIEPLGSCYKKFVLTYRCSDVGRLNSLTVQQGSLVNIDCLQPEKKDAAAAAKISQ